MHYPEQQALASYSPASAVPPSPATQKTAWPIAEAIPFNLERGGRTIEATYSTRNGTVTVEYRGKTLSIYSPQGDEANYKAVARQLLSVMPST